MNCKPGDLAIVVKSDYGNEGLIVRCVHHFVTYRGNDAWQIDPPFPNGRGCDGILDEYLRPIRPDESPPEEGTEAMRRLTQLPQKEKV